MDTNNKTQLESTFSLLRDEERETIISLGAALRLSYLKKRLFQEQYGITLTQLDARGLPDDADYRMHEDCVMWHHWRCSGQD